MRTSNSGRLQRFGSPLAGYKGGVLKCIRRLVLFWSETNHWVTFDIKFLKLKNVFIHLIITPMTQLKHLLQGFMCSREKWGSGESHFGVRGLECLLYFLLAVTLDKSKSLGSSAVKEGKEI